MRVTPSTSNTCNGPNSRSGSLKCYVTGALTSGCNDLDGGYTELLSLISARFEWMHVEKLLRINGEAAYTKAQGES